MNKTMIEVSDASMRFWINSDKIISLKEYVATTLRERLSYQEFTALDNVPFIGKKSKIFGQFGRNGARKSTMLKMISGFLSQLRVACCVREMCSQVAWLADGRLKMIGLPNKVCDAYAS